MKILSLEIENIRGIKSLKLTPDAKNWVIWGPNGSGKSAVVDAIDFLLSGQISRLMGEGTKGISLKEHGPHIDADPDEAYVNAIISLSGTEEPIELHRTMKDPDRLECNIEMNQRLQLALDIAKRGQHKLSRREILQYITAEAGTRAQRVQALLNVSEIERIRKALVSVENEQEKNLERCKRSVSKATNQVTKTLEIPDFNEESALELINNKRAVLGGEKISEIKHGLMKKGITLPRAVTGDQSLNVTHFRKDIGYLLEITLDETQKELEKADKELRGLLKEIREDPDLLRSLDHQKLVKQGLDLLDETGVCPLCETPWPPGELKRHLEAHLESAKTASRYQKRINALRDSLTNRIDTIEESLKKFIEASQLVGLEQERKEIAAWRENLKLLEQSLSEVMENYPISDFGTERVKKLIAPENLLQIIQNVDAKVKEKFPETTPEQNAWDTLTQLEIGVKTLEDEKELHNAAQLVCDRAHSLSESFQAARDSILGKLYTQVETGFTKLYRELHKADESSFDASITADGPSLNFEVDFYGRGSHPPHALHSEGHQDSMGLCLYLALAEELTSDVIDLIILDDVVMSVDSDHRKELCRLLHANFPKRQFLITTHDKTWANQLLHEGIVTSDSLIEFYNWHIDTGPMVNYEADMWQRIESEIAKGDIPGAASHLRRGSEHFFGTVADALQARVRFKMDAKWDLGDLQPAAMGELSKLIKKSKAAAKSWGDKDAQKRLEEIDSVRKQVYERIGAEQWVTNANVHYNNWGNFTENDFRPLVEAYQDLYKLFTCNTCDSILTVITKGYKKVGVRCACGSVNWNLSSKE